MYRTNKLTRLNLLVVALLVCAVGCGKPTDKFIGQYTGKVQLLPLAEKRLAQLPPQAAAQARSTIENLKMNLDLRKDMTYTTNMEFPGNTYSVSGKWFLSNGTLTLVNNSETKNGQTTTLPGNSADVLSPDSEGKVLKMGAASNPALAGMTITFTKGS